MVKMNRMRNRAAVLLAVLATAMIVTGRAAAQEVVTATPVLINLSTLVPPTAAPVVQPTPTWTPTQGIGAQLQALDTANVRQDPDTSAALLGVIRSGERYPVTGRYFQWYQFQFPTAPNGRGWVFGELVEIIGDVNSIPEVDPVGQPTLPPAVFGATLTADIITQTPGGILTATAQAVLPVATTAAEIGAPGQVLPTFTYPPGVVPVAPTPEPTRSILDAGTPTPALVQTTTGSPQDFPPILPIVILAGLGLLGLAISSLRR